MQRLNYEIKMKIFKAQMCEKLESKKITATNKKW